EPAGAEDIRRGEQAWDQIGGGEVRGGDEGPVGERNAQQIGLGAERTHRDAVDAGALVPVATDRTRVVGGPERTHDELARPDRLDVVADFFDYSDVFVAHRHRPGVVSDADPAIRPEIGAA